MLGTWREGGTGILVKIVVSNVPIENMENQVMQDLMSSQQALNIC